MYHMGGLAYIVSEFGLIVRFQFDTGSKCDKYQNILIFMPFDFARPRSMPPIQHSNSVKHYSTMHTSHSDSRVILGCLVKLKSKRPCRKLSKLNTVKKCISMEKAKV